MNASDPPRSTTTLPAVDPFRLLVESVTESAIFLIDPAGRIASWNSGAERIKGYAAAEIIGQPFDMMFGPEDRVSGKARRDMDAALDHGKFEEERLQSRKDGSLFWAGYTLTALHEGERHLGFAVCVRDITDRKEAEGGLRAGAERFRLLIEGVKDYAIYTLDATGVIETWNAGAARLYDYTADEIIGQHRNRLFTAEDVAIRLPPTELERASLSGKASEEGWRVRKDGSRFWANGTMYALYDEAGGVRGFVKVVRDLTERKRAEEDLRAREAESRMWAEALPQIVWTTRPDGWNTYFNQRWMDYTGLTLEESLGHGWNKPFHPEDRQRAMLAWQDATTAISTYSLECRLRRADGIYRWWLIRGVPVKDTAGKFFKWFGTCTDIDDLKRAEGQLQLSENRFRSLVTAMSQIVWTTDATGDNHVTIPTWAEYMGLPEEEVRGWGWLQAVHPDDRERAAARWRHSLETKERYETNYRIRRADGEWRHFIVRGVPLLDDAGSVREWVGVCQDGTERRRAEEGMRLRDRAIQAVAQGILIADATQPDYPVVYASPSYLRITGYTAESLMGKSCQVLFGPNTDAAELARMKSAVAARQPYSGEMLSYRKDGTTFWDEVHLNPFYSDDQVMYYIGVHSDVTARRSLESQLQQSQKMEAVGRLAGGVAHDFNNLLTIISGYSDMLLLEMPPSNPQQGLVAEIRQAGERAAGLTRQLLAFSRKQVIQPIVLDLNDVVAQAEKMLRRLLGEDITIAAVLSPSLPRVKADPGQVDQVVTNLCVNARDAMPTGGRLIIETREFVLEESLATFPGLKLGRFAQLSVADTGHGMTEEVKAQIFEPFFTTKGVGRGTGLGLATVSGIVNQCNGHISVYSEVGVGTTFKILFPAVDAAPTRSSDSGVFRPLRGTETVLLVEDEDGVRKIARISLETQGYTVLEASSGIDAIQRADQHVGPIHLVVTDVVMPDMGGGKLAEALRSRHPGIKVLFMSGYTDDAMVRNGIIAGTDTFFQKPFTPLGLAKKVREVLDEKK